MDKPKGRGGPKTPFGPKDLPNRSHSLTKLAKQIEDAAAERAGTSASNVVELLLRKHGGELSADDFAELPDSEPTQDQQDSAAV